MADIISTPEDLLSAAAVRSQSARVTAHVRSGGGVFAVDDSKLAACADLVVEVTKDRYPTLNVPYHSRWRHFHAPGSSLRGELDERLAGLDATEAARVGFDLVIPSVLLDAGAGPNWRFAPRGIGEPVGRSEGLGLASLQMFLDGQFSTDTTPRTDAAALAAFNAASLKAGFQVREGNPLVGVEGRAAMLRELALVITGRPEVFPTGRLGEMADYATRASSPVTGPSLLAIVLDVLAPIWPDRLRIDGVSLGDAWVYEPFGDGLDAIVPFHKLSQWLTYSLAETLILSGIEVADLDGLSGLPEYRNGGLLLETGVLGLRDASLANVAHRPDSQVIVEWRALTITLLDEIAALVRDRLDSPKMPLAEILEGGTWATGRRLAFARTADGSPPLTLDSDGTVF